MRRDHRFRIYADLNIIPMLDVAYVLVVVFILLSTVSVSGVEVDLPEISAREQLPVAEARAISIDAFGQISLDGYPVTEEQLAAEMARSVAQNPDVPVIIRGDTSADIGQLMKVVDTVRSVGVKRVGLPADAAG